MIQTALLLTLTVLIRMSLCEYKLQFVLETFRHGARDPILSESPYYDAQQWPDIENESGELTAPGMRMHFLLGVALRNHYINDMQFLPPVYNASLLYAFCDNDNRTMQSIASQLVGWYPMGTGPQLPADDYPMNLALPPFLNVSQPEGLFLNALPFGFQPIPVITNDDKPQNIIDGQYYNTCPYLQTLYNNQANDAYYKTLEASFAETFLNLSALLHQAGYPDQNIQSMYEVARFMENLECDYAQNRTLIAMSDDLRRTADFLWVFQIYENMVGSVEQQRLTATPFLKKLLNLFGKGLDLSDPLKIGIFSAHDNTLIYLTAALNLTSSQCISDMYFKNKTDAVSCITHFPIFASSLIFELYADDQFEGTFQKGFEFSAIVKIMYEGVYMNLCGRQNTECAWTEFKQRLENFILPEDEYKATCNQNTTTF